VLSIHAEAELPPFTGSSPFTSWEPFQLLTLGLLIAVGLYLWGVSRLVRRGDAWPLHRTLVFLVGGVGSIAFVTLGGVAAYDDVLLSDHMIQHMVLAMLAPICLALGAPVTLALRTLPPKPRHWLVAALHSKIAKVLSFPLVSFGLYVATPFALYFSGIYRFSLQHEWFHDLTHVHFILIGCLFFWPLIGLDPLPGRWPYPARALLMILSTPFHAVLGLTIMQSSTLIAGSYYPDLHLGWADPVTDQRVAGGILWAGGEIVTVVMLAALVAQWMRSADKEAIRIDRRLDREDAARGRSTARLSQEDAMREREAAWSAASGIPMMDDPTDAAASDSVAYDSAVSDSAASDIATSGIVTSGTAGSARDNDQATGTDDAEPPSPGGPAAPSDPTAPTATVMADRRESGAQTR
jgi:putative copper resistance protein D